MGDDGELFVFELGECFLEVWCLGAAGGAGGMPKVEEDVGAAVVSDGGGGCF